MVRGVTLLRPVPASSAARSLVEQVGQQDLAAGGGVQRGQLSDPVVRADGSRSTYLVEVDRVILLQHGDVDGFADLLGEPLADRAALLGDVDASRDRTGQPYDAEAEAVLAALARLLHQAARLQGAEQSERGGLVHLDLGRHLADPCLATLGQDLQDADGAVDRLHSMRPANLTFRCLGCGCSQ